VSSLPARLAAAIGAWGALIVYVVLMRGFLDEVWSLPDDATTAPILDVGQTNFTALFGTGVVGVIAGLAGVSVAQALAGRSTILGGFLVVRRGSPTMVGTVVGTIAGLVYMGAYFVLAVAGLLVWQDRGSGLTPEFIQGQVLAAAGLLLAMAALSSAKTTVVTRDARSLADEPQTPLPIEQPQLL
jgi:hypothetical protein